MLRSQTAVLEVVDREFADPDSPLVGVPWTANPVISGDAVSSTPGHRVRCGSATPVAGAEAE